MGRLQDSLSRMDVRFADKFHQIEDTLKRLTNTLLLNREGYSSNTSGQPGQTPPYRNELKPFTQSVTYMASKAISDGSHLRVAYTYGESAAQKAYPNCVAVLCKQFDTAFEGIEQWLVERAVLTIENSLGESFNKRLYILRKKEQKSPGREGRKLRESTGKKKSGMEGRQIALEG